MSFQSGRSHDSICQDTIKVFWFRRPALGWQFVVDSEERAVLTKAPLQDYHSNERTLTNPAVLLPEAQGDVKTSCDFQIYHIFARFDIYKKISNFKHSEILILLSPTFVAARLRYRVGKHLFNSTLQKRNEFWQRTSKPRRSSAKIAVYLCNMFL